MSAFFLLQSYLRRTIQNGQLTVIDAVGKSHIFGRAAASGRQVTVEITKPSLYWKLALMPDPAAGEAFMDGSLKLHDGTIFDLFALLSDQPGTKAGKNWNRINLARRKGFTSNRIGKAQQNVAHHYDLNRQLFELFLDEDLQYSCAYFQDKNMSLDQAQLAKKQHLAAKLDLNPGMKVLDIGCGFGGLAIFLAETCNVSVVGVTLSEEQYRLACKKCVERGLQDKVEFRLLDYRQLDGDFDRIVSVGMFEHVGEQHYGEYFDKVNDLLTEDGVALIHTIGRLYGPMDTSRWISKYIFPGGRIPALSELAPVCERAGLIVCDHEVLRLHYALTLKEWRRRFMKNRKRAQLLYDERFCRMWEFYLASSEASFRFHDLVIFQLQLSKNINTLPITRDYMHVEEAQLAEHYPKLQQPGRKQGRQRKSAQ
ncbi:MAG: cyclopropane-fatty-acyl-phospholipid synthase family protein [Rhizobiaceae bacterium]